MRIITIKSALVAAGLALGSLTAGSLATTAPAQAHGFGFGFGHGGFGHGFGHGWGHGFGWAFHGGGGYYGGDCYLKKSYDDDGYVYWSKVCY